MKDGWEVILLDDEDHERLVTELLFNGKFLGLLDYEDGPTSPAITLHSDSGEEIRVSLKDFLKTVRDATVRLTEGECGPL